MRPSAALRRLALAALALLLAACNVPFAPYTVSSANITAIRATQRRVELGDFLGRQDSVSCRFRRIGPDGDRTFAQYLRAAFNDELVIADARTGSERSTLSIKVTDVSVDCGNIWGSWTIEGEVSIGSQQPFTVKARHDFDGSFLMDIVQQRANQAFVPTAQAFIAAVVSHPTFKDEFGNRRAAAPAADAAAKPAAPAEEPASAAAPRGIGRGISS